MNNYENAVLVSYAWGGESERIVDKLESAFAVRGIRIIRDKKDLGYKGSIEAFEQRIGQGYCIVLVIGDKYLRSEHCMYELAEVDKNRNLRDRIFPIVLADAKIYKAIDRLNYIKHWDEQIEQLNNAIRGVNTMANLSGFTADLDKFSSIRASFDHLTDLLSDMNVLTPDVHTANGFSTLIGAVEYAIARNSVQAKTKQVELILEGEFDEFTSNRQQDIVGVLAALLRIDPINVRVLKVSKGSIVITIEIPDSAANRLYEMATTRDFRIMSLGIKSVMVDGREIIKLADKTAMIQGNRTEQLLQKKDFIKPGIFEINSPGGRGIMSSEYPNFVGREGELNAFRQLLKNPYGKVRIPFILGGGGTGKTLLVKRMLGEAQESGILVAEEPIDLFSTDYRHIDGIQWRIKEIIESLPALKGRESPFVGFVKGKTDTNKKFNECLKEFCATHPLVLAFDTFEYLDKVVSDWLFNSEEGGLQVLGLICIIASRYQKDNLETYRKNLLVKELPISGFTLKEAEEFYQSIKDEFKLRNVDPLEALLKEAGLSINDSVQNSIEWVRKITAGHPLRLEMVFRWSGTLLEAKKLKDLTTDGFEEKLMMEVRELAERGQLDVGPNKKVSQPVYDTLICMAHITRRFDGHLLRYLIDRKLIRLDEPNVSEKDILETLEKYFFVKVRSESGSEPVIQLHDEMARLVREYVWPFLDSSGERKQTLLMAVDQYYDQLIDQKTGEESDTLWVEKLYYAFQRDWKEDGKRLWFELAEWGNENINKLLPGEIKDYIERYDREIQYAVNRAIAEIEREAQHINQSLGYWEKVRKLGEEEKRDDWVAHALFGMSSCEGDSTKALDLLEKAKTICVEKAPEILPNVYYNMGFTYRRMQDINKTIYWYREAKDQFQKNPWDQGLEAKIANDLGYAYSFVGEWDECRKNVNAGLRIRKNFLVEIEQKIIRIQASLDSPANEEAKGKLRDELSRQKNRKSKAIFQLGLSYNTLGQIYRYQDELDEALQNYEQAYELFVNTKNYAWQAKALFSRGETHRRIARVKYEQGNEKEYQDQIEKAQKDIEDSLYLCDKYHLKDDKDTANRRLGRCLHDLALYSYKHDRSTAMELLNKARVLFIEGAEYARKTNDVLEELENIQELAFIADDVMEITGSSELPSEWQGSMDKFEQALENHRADEFRIYQFPVFENLLEFEKAAIDYRSKKYGDALKGYLKAYGGLISDPGYGSARYRQHYSQLTRTIDVLPTAEAANWCDEFIRVWETTYMPGERGRTLAQEDPLGLVVWCKRQLKNIEARKV